MTEKTVIGHSSHHHLNGTAVCVPGPQGNIIFHPNFVQLLWQV